MPWMLRVKEEEVAEAVDRGTTWREVLDALGYLHGSSQRPSRCARFSYSYTDDELRDAVVASFSWAEVLRRLGYCPTGGNWKTLKTRVAERGISTEEGLKERRCELCRQDENWQGTRIGLILDHINGVRGDNRLENLRIVCPNCAAGLETYCGRKNRLEWTARECLRCGNAYVPRSAQQSYCSPYCGTRWDRRGRSVPAARKVERPPYETLLAEVRELGYVAVGRKYGVSDNAIRKWLRQYERERADADGRDPDVIEIPTRTWPNQRRREGAA